MISQQERLIGYARVSTVDQELNLQLDALLEHGVEKKNLYCDKISGARLNDPVLLHAWMHFGEGTRWSKKMCQDSFQF